MLMRIVFVFVIGWSLLCAVPGCSGSGGSTTNVPASLTPEQEQAILQQVNQSSMQEQGS